jgi:hypothetical protein
LSADTLPPDASAGTIFDDNVEQRSLSSEDVEGRHQQLLTCLGRLQQQKLRWLPAGSWRDQWVAAATLAHDYYQLRRNNFNDKDHYRALRDSALSAKLIVAGFRRDDGRVMETEDGDDSHGPFFRLTELGFDYFDASI